MSKKQVNLAEDIVENVLNKLKEEKKIFGFLKNRHCDRIDEEGADFIIVLNNKFWVPLQVKTESFSESYEKQYAEHIRKHPFVKFLIAVSIRHFEKQPERVYALARKQVEGILYEVTSALK